MPMACPCRCVRPDQSSATVRLHYLTDGNVNFAFTINRAEYFIPVGLLFRALFEVRNMTAHWLQSDGSWSTSPFATT